MWIFFILGCSTTGTTTIVSSDTGDMDTASIDLEPSDNPTEDTAEEDTAEEDTAVNTEPVDGDGDGFLSSEDCNDDNADVYPGASEICDNQDNNCDDTIDEGDVCPCPYRAEGNKGFYFCSDPLKWVSARNFCEDQGASLASIESEEENSLLFTTISETEIERWWIGLKDRGDEETFLWQDESAVGYENWNEGEPNNFNGNEDCVEIMLNGGLWNDARCRDEKSFICSFSLEE